MVRSLSSFHWLLAAGALLVGDVVVECAKAQGPRAYAGERSPGVYQRRGSDSQHWRGRDRHDRDRSSFYYNAPAVSSGWFQRPYPYHLDYYRMKYGGSYAPYFGNLYGPPQVVTAPPYFGPYYGGYDYAAPYGLNAPVPFAPVQGGNPPFEAGKVDGEPATESAVEQREALNGEMAPGASP